MEKFYKGYSELIQRKFIEAELQKKRKSHLQKLFLKKFSVVAAITAILITLYISSPTYRISSLYKKTTENPFLN